MRNFQFLLPLALSSFCISGCRSGDKTENSTPNLEVRAMAEKHDLAYFDRMATWREKRTASLKADDGWLNLVGLFWLKEGENTMGTTADNRIVLQHGMADALIGSYFLIKGELSFRAAHGRAVSIKGTDTFVDSLKVYPLDSTRVLAHRRLEWFPIKRGDQFGIRI